MVEASGEAGTCGTMIFQTKHICGVRIEASGEAGPRRAIIVQTKHTCGIWVEASGEAGPRGEVVRREHGDHLTRNYNK